MKKLSFSVLFLLFYTSLCYANTPGSHSVSLTWIETDPTASSYNVYRGVTTGVCTGTPTPFVKGITTKSYTDASVVAGTTYFYATSAVNSAGGESTCSNEVQVSVPTSPTAPSNLQGTAQ